MRSANPKKARVALASLHLFFFVSDLLLVHVCLRQHAHNGCHVLVMFLAKVNVLFNILWVKEILLLSAAGARVISVSTLMRICLSSWFLVII